MYAKTVRHSDRKGHREKNNIEIQIEMKDLLMLRFFLCIFLFVLFFAAFLFSDFFFENLFTARQNCRLKWSFFRFICIRWISIEDFTLLLLLKWCFRFRFSFSSSALIFEVGETYCIVICLWLVIIAHTHTSASNYISEYLWVFTAINIS